MALSKIESKLIFETLNRWQLPCCTDKISRDATTLTAYLAREDFCSDAESSKLLASLLGAKYYYKLFERQIIFSVIRGEKNFSN